MSGRCMANLPPTRELIGLKIPYGAWEPDTLITDTYGNPIFSVLDVQHHAMGSYEAIFGDENGHKLCYIKRRLITKYWLDGWDFCTYKPNFPDQPKYKERDMYGKSVYPFSFLQVQPLKCRYQYSVHEENLEGMEVHLEAMHGWLGSMTVCCTPMVRLGKWQLEFHRPSAGDPEINIDQSKNLLEVERGNDLLAALCIAYAFDKALCQPLVTIIGYQEKEHPDDDDDSDESFEPEAPRNYPMLMAPPEEEDEEYDEEFVPAGYLGYEDPDAEEEEEDQPEVAGYLEGDYEQDDYEDPENPEGYIEDGRHTDDTFEDERY
eukprot:Nitzschia sp. Nitz4//scaffold10_size219509//149937//151033//NITZ4_001446-RA/size219509-augustus-gene-0.278-mRNA-1//-1//CDS//3329532974//106//frame0